MPEHTVAERQKRRLEQRQFITPAGVTAQSLLGIGPPILPQPVGAPSMEFGGAVEAEIPAFRSLAPSAGVDVRQAGLPGTRVGPPARPMAQRPSATGQAGQPDIEELFARAAMGDIDFAMIAQLLSSPDPADQQLGDLLLFAAEQAETRRVQEQQQQQNLFMAFLQNPAAAGAAGFLGQGFGGRQQNPFLQQLFGAGGLVGRQGAQAPQGLQQLGIQRPRAENIITAGLGVEGEPEDILPNTMLAGAPTVESFFGGGAPNLLQLQGLDPASLGFLQALLGFTGLETPFIEQAQQRTPARAPSRFGGRVTTAGR